LTKGSTVAKGNKFVIEAMEIYQASGYQVWKPGKAVRFIGEDKWVSQPQDICGAFDLIAWKSDNIQFIQCKSGGRKKKEKETDKISNANEYHASQARILIDSLDFPESPAIKYVVLARVEGYRYRFVIWRKENKEWKRIGEVRMTDPEGEKIVTITK
jgi:hypothetical protein